PPRGPDQVGRSVEEERGLTGRLAREAPDAQSEPPRCGGAACGRDGPRSTLRDAGERSWARDAGAAGGRGLADGGGLTDGRLDGAERELEDEREGDAVGRELDDERDGDAVGRELEDERDGDAVGLDPEDRGDDTLREGPRELDRAPS